MKERYLIINPGTPPKRKRKIKKYKNPTDLVNSLSTGLQVAANRIKFADLDERDERKIRKCLSEINEIIIIKSRML